MKLPLDVLIVRSIQELTVGCIAHHRDFCWERERYLIGAVVHHDSVAQGNFSYEVLEDEQRPLLQRVLTSYQHEDENTIKRHAEMAGTLRSAESR